MSSSFETTTTIRFHQADPAGIMFFGHIFTMAHDSYEQFVRHLGYEWKDWFQNPQFALPIKHTSSDFYKPFRAGESYQIQITVAELGETHFKLTFVFAQEGALHARVQMVQVGFDPQKRQKLALPEKLREKLKNYVREIPHD